MGCMIAGIAVSVIAGVMWYVYFYQKEKKLLQRLYDMIEQAEEKSFDADAAASFCNAPIQGRMPENKDEIALSSLVLDALGIPYKTDEETLDKNIFGEKVSLTIALDNADVKDELVTHDFYLCGWWEGDVSDYSQYAWVSEAFAKEVNERGMNASWWGMALGNFGRNWKRGIIVMLSIALSLLILNGIFMMVRGYSLDVYQESYMASDFELDKLPDYAPYAVMNGVTEETQELINACPYAESSGYVRYSEEYHEMEPHLYEIWDEIARERLSGEWIKRWELMKAENQMNITLMGIDQAVFDKLQWRGETHTWEEFSGGGYIIVDYPLLAGQGVHNYQTGDHFVMRYQSGTEKEYQVLDEARLPYSLDYPYANLITVTVMIPDEEFIACTGSVAAMHAFIDAVPGSEEKVQQYLEETVLAGDSALLLHSVLDLKASFERFLNKYYFVGGALAFVLALIGIMNFFNMMAASVLSRKRELALLEVVGMTKRQICRVLMAEGCLYLGGAFLLAVFVTVVSAGQLLTAVLGKAFFFRIKVTVLPCMVLLPLLIALAFFIPVKQFRQMTREGIVERIVQ